MRVDVSRRKFMIASTAVGAGLVLATYLYSRKQEYAHEKRSVAEEEFRPNVWLRIDIDGTVTVTVAKSEMGQGVWTALPMLVAEELEANWRRVNVEQALADTTHGDQTTQGSSSVRDSWDTLRQAGAVAREMLIAAAAAEWNVPVRECRAQDSFVTHRQSRRKSSFGELSVAAARQPVPESVELKEPGRFRIIGKLLLRLDTPSKVNGRALFGMDVSLPGMLFATITHSPVFGGKPAVIVDGPARAIRGVRHVVRLDTGVAVVADSYWAAKQGLDLLDITWDLPKGPRWSSPAMRDHFAAVAEQAGVTVREDGEFERGLSSAVKVIEATYETPFHAHATMEPMNCTASVRDGICEVWAPTQSPDKAQATAHRHAFPAHTRFWHKLRGRWQHRWQPPVIVHTTFMGGGFGRRLQQDYVAEAVQISRIVGAPVKLIWSREEDMQHDYYRPASHNRLVAGLDARGMPVAWDHKIVGPSIRESLEPGSVRNGFDRSAVQGAIRLPYSIPNMRVRYVMAQVGVPCGLWRSVGHSNNAFVTECFLDELAVVGGNDPLTFRLALLADSPRERAVLELAAKKAGWRRRRPRGRYQGLAMHRSSESRVAQVAEISISESGQLRVHRVVCAIDCGTVVNPNVVAAQMEGSVVFALSAVMKGAITFREGRVEQSNFHDYPILRIDEMPEVETHIVSSHEPPAGVGEPGVPPVIPAVMNAIFAATHRRIRRLPVQPGDLLGHR